MKAGVLYGNEDIRYTDIDIPEISDNELLVKVRVTGICGSDIPRVLHNGAHFYPIVLGHEFSGEIVKKGNKVTKFVRPEKGTVVDKGTGLGIYMGRVTYLFGDIWLK